MKVVEMNGTLFDEILQNGYKNLALHYEAINELNVFPVPDGDTGTNMKLTFNNGLKSVDATNTEEIGTVAESLAKGMLFGARGNSGVLTSQYFKGIADYLKEKKSVTVQEFAEALVNGYKTAYSATVTPTEGTILTVAREGIENIKPTINSASDFENFFAQLVDAMRVSLDNTPNLLEVLKDAGVIDSGGKGLLTIFEGMLKYFRGEELTAADGETSLHGGAMQAIDYSAFNENSILDYGYCTEFLLQLLTSKIKIEEFDINEFIAYLQKHGDSIVCFQTGTIVKVHIHTKKPYEVIEYAQKFGEFVGFKMENMALQHNEVVKKEKVKKQSRKKYAIITIGQGDGIIDTFKDLGADIVLNGGQTMNTSTAEMIDAFKRANADEIILLPNESNIIMAAKQAAELYKDSKVRVVETKTIPDGYNALSMILGGTESAEEAYNAMVAAKEGFDSGFVTKSIRDTLVDGVEVKNGEYITGFNKTLISSVPSRDEAVLSFLEHAKNIEDKAVLVIFYGQMVSEEDNEKLQKLIAEKYPDIEVGFIAGGQDVYDYLLGLS